MSKSKKIKVGISCGDVNGIGMEIILKTFADSRVMDHCTPVIYAPKSVFNYYLKIEGIDLGGVRFSNSADKLDLNKINVIDLWDQKIDLNPGESTRVAGKLAYESLKHVTEDLAATKVDVLVTAPINKKNMQSEDFKFPGHTEFLANYANEENPVMILANEGLRVALVTGHIPLEQVSKQLKTLLITKKLDVLNRSLQQDFGIHSPRIAVLGVNPHNGDEGLMGDQEKTVIEPAIAKAQSDGILAFGPYPADGLFGSPALHKFDAVLAMYHDQGLTPFKALAFDKGVNFTAGLPIVRTSPDHGVAYDIAAQNKASEESFRQALFMAIDIYKRRAEHRELTQNKLETQSAK